jgi:hypothetical protein
MGMVVRYCSVCDAVRAFERVPCGDGHGSDCPELVCIECGYVAVVGLVEDLLPVDGALVRSVA